MLHGLMGRGRRRRRRRRRLLSNRRVMRLNVLRHSCRWYNLRRVLPLRTHMLLHNGALLQMSLPLMLRERLLP